MVNPMRLARRAGRADDESDAGEMLAVREGKFMTYDAVIRAFLEAHPKWREDVRWETLPGEREPQALIRPEAMEALTWWAYQQGMVTKPQRIPALLDLMHGIERDREPHDRGICNPTTCVSCSPNPKRQHLRYKASRRRETWGVASMKRLPH